MAISSARGKALVSLAAFLLLAAPAGAQQGFWNDVQPAGAPSFRATHGLAFEPTSELFVVYGGVPDMSALTVFDETWAFDGCDWTQLFPSGNPGPRENVYLAQSPNPGRLVMFGGGVMAFVVDGSTWEFDVPDSTWIDVTPASPSPSARQLANTVYDSWRDRTVLFGGTNEFGGVFHGDTWEWDGSAWTNVTPAGPSPSPRAWHAMTFDEERGRTVLFGGFNGGQLGDTWEWDGAQWTQVFPAGSPPAQSSGAIAYDAWSRRVVLFGGSTGWPIGMNATWEYDGTSWVQVGVVGSSPPPQYLHRMTGDPVRGGILLFGAFGNGWAPLGQTWRYHHATLTAGSYAPAAGKTVRLSLDFPGEGGNAYVMAISASGSCPGIGLREGRYVPLNSDVYTQASLSGDFPHVFHDFSGVLDATGRATAAFTIPTALGGATVSVAAVTVAGVSIASVSNPLALTVP